jgi:tetratricopeptide (TPR) repeat protein
MPRTSPWCAVAWAALTLQATAALAAPPGAPPPPAARPPSVATLIKQGEDAFDGGTFDQARDAFSTALAVDPKNMEAARDLGIAYLRLGQPTKAAKPLQQAAAGKSLDRPLVLALAYEYIASKSPMQGVRPVLNYLNAQGGTPDESMVNALGIALASADARGIRGSLLADGHKAYQKLNAKLEATRPGEKRWATEWLPEAEVDGRQTTVTTAQATATSAAAAIQNLQSRIASLQRQADAVPHTEGDNNMTQKKAALQKQIDDLEAKLPPEQKKLEDAQKTLTDTQPKWPENVPVESLTLQSSGDGGPSAAPAGK